MLRSLTAPTLLAVSLLSGLWFAGTLGLAYESRQLLEHCKATSADPASCHLRIYGR